MFSKDAHGMANTINPDQEPSDLDLQHPMARNISISYQGVSTLSMIKHWSVKRTSNYPTSCLKVRRKQKVNKLIFKGCSRKTYVASRILITTYSLVVHVCKKTIVDNCLSDNYAIIVRYAVYKE